ncbi:competence protein [Sporosarcina sp. ANT_H38]|uniref:competence protein ComK n=1 Tax=Sporosarcina sp. ANT_H38 TaxID=2597358 RepID=UPI0011F2BD17|nr:competence protein ComK [Sporosarcina sp. ANT_H38]KAA0955514.1 competence protein [Sporosarcina sp. ANT_H38]
MLHTNNFVLDYDTISFLPRYDESGCLRAIVRDVNGSFDVDLAPTLLMDYNLRYYGSSLRGATDGANMILGNGHMPPVIVNEKLGIYWIPSKSPYNGDCMWFALHHIKDYFDIGGNRTKIIFSDGSTQIIDISRSAFDLRVQKAYKLKGKIEYRTIGTPMRV